MSASFFFYDLETSGLNPKTARIMQFAGQRTDMDLRPIGGQVNQLIKLTPDTLPDPDAILVTGITPQATLEHGVTEAEFLRFFSQEVAVPDTIFVGYNSIRFDDEFMRYLHYRNFYDAYKWQWCDGCSRWDMLDIVRMTRALRPEGIQWPMASDGSSSNKLELITSLNGLDHENAHDALSDVGATIAVAQLIKNKQPKLFQFMLDMRQKQQVAGLVRSGEPFVYTSGTYPSEYEKTTVAVLLAECADGQSAIVYDLRVDPATIAGLSARDLTYRSSWRARMEGLPPLPAKVLKYNRCPAVAPLSVLEAASQERLKLDMEQIAQNRAKLQGQLELTQQLLHALDPSHSYGHQAELVTDELTVDERLYDGFFSKDDAYIMERIRLSRPGEFGVLQQKLHDERLRALLPLYKARNFPSELTTEEHAHWEAFCERRLTEDSEKSVLSRYYKRLEYLAQARNTTNKQQFLLEELRLYAESITPAGVLAS